MAKGQVLIDEQDARGKKYYFIKFLLLE